MRARNFIFFIFFVVFLFQNFIVNAQNASENKNEEYEILINKDTITGVYIPKDIYDCINQLDIFLTDSLKTEIKKMTEDEFSIEYHFFLGMWLRNNWGLWKGSRLQVYFNNLGIEQPDNMSDFILRCYYKKLQGKKIKTKREIKRYEKMLNEFETNIILAETIDNTRFYELDSALLFADEIVAITIQNYNKLPRQILRFKNLHYISIQYSNELDWKRTFKLLKRFKDLKELSLYGNQVESYPKNIGSISGLETLWIVNDSIKSLPETIRNLSNLTELYISNCLNIEVVSLFKQLADLDSLERLFLTENELTFIPREIYKLKKLSVLRLGNNLLNEIPEEAKKMQNLTSLSLSHNKMLNIDFENGDLPNLTEIFLDNCGLNNFPLGLTNLKNLESILMQDNEIEDIPNEISNLENLIRLELQNNRISILPNSFCKLKKLEKLNFSNNNLNDSVFDLLLCLSYLKEISLVKNNIKQIPEEIYLLENLEGLYLSGNKEIITIPNSFAKLKNLKYLGLSNCPNLNFEDLINALYGLELKELMLYENKISDEIKMKLHNLFLNTKKYY